MFGLSIKKLSAIFVKDIKLIIALIILTIIIVIGVVTYNFYKDKNLIKANLIFNSFLKNDERDFSKLITLKNKNIVLYNTYLFHLYTETRDIKYLQHLVKNKNNSFIIKDYISYYTNVLNPSTANFRKYYENRDHINGETAMLLHARDLSSKGNLFKAKLVLKQLLENLKTLPVTPYTVFLKNQTVMLYGYVGYSLKDVKK